MDKVKLFLYAVWISILASVVIPSAFTKWLMVSILSAWGIFVAVVVCRGMNKERKVLIERLRQVKKKPFPDYETNERSTGTN